jgi:hypothetical protein
VRAILALHRLAIDQTDKRFVDERRGLQATALHG